MKEIRTVTQLQVPTLLAKPALRIPNIPQTPPDTHSKPDTKPIGDTSHLSPRNSNIHEVIKHIAVLYV
jgi:hypothetical protein